MDNSSIMINNDNNNVALIGGLIGGGLLLLIASIALIVWLVRRRNVNQNDSNFELMKSKPIYIFSFVCRFERDVLLKLYVIDSATETEMQSARNDGGNNLSNFNRNTTKSNIFAIFRLKSIERTDLRYNDSIVIVCFRLDCNQFDDNVCLFVRLFVLQAKRHSINRRSITHVNTMQSQNVIHPFIHICVQLNKNLNMAERAFRIYK